MSTPERHVTLVWLGLVSLTLGAARLGDSGLPGAITGAVVALVMAGKGFLVIRNYMGLRDPGSRLGQAMGLYFLAVPALILVAVGWGPGLAL